MADELKMDVREKLVERHGTGGLTMDVREKLVGLCEDLETLPCCDTYEVQEWKVSRNENRL